MSGILVTGATGTIGSRLVELLREKGMDFTAAVTSQAKAAPLEARGVRTAVMDYAEPESLKAAMSGKDCVFLLQPFRPELKAWGLAAVAAAKAVGVKHLVRSSGMGADTDAHFKLGKEHGLVDDAVIQSGLGFTLLRPNVFMQNFITSQAGMVRSGVMALPWADSKVSFIDARDIAAAAAAVLADPGAHDKRTYVLTGPEALSMDGAAVILTRVTGREVRYQDLSEDQAREAMLASGLPEWHTNMLLGLGRYIVNRLASFRTQAVEHLTGRPANGFEAFCTEHKAVWG